MEFRWTETQEEFYRSVLEFAQNSLNSSVKERDKMHTFGREEWASCGKQGLLGMSSPEQYGGIGSDALTAARVMEALGRGCEDRGLVFSIAAHLFACVMPIAEHGSEELKEKFLPRLCSGAWIGANAITESEAGSDVYALKTKALRVDDSYVLSGTKIYVTNGPAADVFLVYATTNPAYGYLGVSAFIVERDTPGLIIGEPFRKMGLKTSPTSSIYLEECRIQASNRLGAEGKGGQIFNSSMKWERSCLFALYAGMMERQLDQCIAFARERRQFGKAIGKNQAISHRIANMKLRLEGARMLLYRACWLLDQGEDALLDVAMAKLAISEAAIHSSLDAIQIHGGVGYDEEAGISRALRDAIPSTIFSGTSEIQRDIVATEVGL
jgi:alkylation response protein AidB-like acyl-CoA dehydrogenase